MITLSYSIKNQNIDTTDKFFKKDFCNSENNLLTDILYTDNSELSYDSSGCPISIKIIHKWNELSIVNQNLITSRLNAQGYIDFTSELQ